jgi:hypothetical protein
MMCALAPMILSRHCSSNPFITESTVIITHTPSATPPRVMMLVTEMNACLRLANR